MKMNKNIKQKNNSRCKQVSVVIQPNVEAEFWLQDNLTDKLIEKKLMQTGYPLHIEIKSELEINSQFIESFNTKNSCKEFEIDKTYKNLSLSNLAIERRQSIIINRLNGLKNENRIESKILISSRGLVETVEIKNLTPKRLKNDSKIFLKESWNFLK